MRNKHKAFSTLTFILGFASFFLNIGCTNEWLEVKPTKKSEIPNSLSSALALLDNARYMNDNIYSPLGVVSSDNLIALESGFQRFSNLNKNIYLWRSDMYEGHVLINDHWSFMYKVILYANLALEVLNDLNPNTEAELEQIEIGRGRAHFFRGYAFYHLTMLYGDVHLPEYQVNGLGIPLRLTSDINVVSERSTIQGSYDQIFEDLKLAATLLTDYSEVNRRPTRPAAYAMLAKTALQIQDFASAKAYADSCLQIYAEVVDYNLVEDSAVPFDETNAEIIHFTTMTGNSLTGESNIEVNPDLYHLYQDTDLRKSLFFKENNGRISFKGGYSYDGFYNTFNGLTVPEMILIQAECNARLGLVDEARKSLSNLIRNRYIDGKELEIPSDGSELLLFIFDERRRELAFRGVRWYDLRRLNLEEEFQTTLIRSLEGIDYVLPPNDPRYLLEIPPTVIDRSNVLQNDR